ncbi:MAG: ATP-binding cassette domain-containing protein [Verrucomicrobiales bacterium]|nr:ATP-binding cassette domain-containing protein [Verrucomicrobiales bacterium]
MGTVIQVENLSKLYRLGEVSTGTISHDINRWWHRVRGKEDPYAQVGQVNNRERSMAGDGLRPEDHYVWALRDINFRVEHGEVLGIIGRNGAGKSTLLKILSRVTAPSSGRIKVKGRIASLLEVGTGFHSELTGRENIFLNGAILGMRSGEIRRKLDEIVDFSGCAAYLDTPVKRYSSGMTVRMAFAVAAFLEAEILVIDEVLAVGDAEFQKKCLGKMGDVAALGRTLLFVSHNMATIQRLCGRVLLLDSGVTAGTGDAPSIIGKYFRHNNLGSATSVLWPINEAPGNSKVLLRKVAIVDGAGRVLPDQVLSTESVAVMMEFDAFAVLDRLVVGIEIWQPDGAAVLTSYHRDMDDSRQMRYEHGTNRWQVTIPSGLLNAGRYVVTACIGEHDRGWICRVEAAVRFSVIISHGTSQFLREYQARGIIRPGVIAPVLEWEKSRSDDET